METNNNLIQEDYEYFNINKYENNKIKNNNRKGLNIDKLSFTELFELIKNNNFRCSYYDKSIYLTQDILDKIIENDNIINKEIYKIILFINSYNNGDAHEEYELFDEETDDPKFNKFKSYKKIFDEYFDKRYKEKNTIDNELIMTRLHIFNYHYDRIYPHNFNKRDNPNEYNNVSKNKSNLKTQYKKYLEGEKIENLKNIPALKMMIYIIENTPTN